MRTFGYGEDALTYWALSRHLPEVLGGTEIGDGFAPDRTVVFYRPSFGRAGGNASPQFGEFDAIIGTRKAVYLVESKWVGQTIIDGEIRLDGPQTLRHRIFHWIRDRWLQQRAAEWALFHDANAAAFSGAFRGKPLARPGTRLASNLHFVLERLATSGTPIRDVLLYFSLPDGEVPKGVAMEPGFIVVPFVFNPLNPEHGGRVIDMQI